MGVIRTGGRGALRHERRHSGTGARCSTLSTGVTGRSSRASAACGGKSSRRCRRVTSRDSLSRPGSTGACRQLGLPIETTLLYGIKHLVKEKKRGLVRGSLARVRMFAAVYRAYTSLRFRQPGARTTSLRSSLPAGVEYTIF